MRSCWAGLDVRGNKAYVLKEKLKLLKTSLRKWNKEVFGVLDFNIDDDVKDLNEIDSLLVNSFDVEAVCRRKEVSTKFWRDIRLKESLLCQKSRDRWIREGDSNTKYFHSLLKFRRRRSNLLLMDESGALIEDVEEVKLRVKTHFEKCFEEPHQDRPILGGLEFKQISNEDNSLLLMPFMEEENKGEIWNCDGE